MSKKRSHPEINIEICPRCGSSLRDGWLGEGWYIRWYDENPGWFHFVIEGEKLIDAGLYLRAFAVTPAKRCNNCRLVIFEADGLKKGVIDE